MTILVVAQTSSVITRKHERKHGTKDITISVSWDLGSLNNQLRKDKVQSQCRKNLNFRQGPPNVLERDIYTYFMSINNLSSWWINNDISSFV
jgi:hypothetical protein